MPMVGHKQSTTGAYCRMVKNSFIMKWYHYYVRRFKTNRNALFVSGKLIYHTTNIESVDDSLGFAEFNELPPVIEKIDSGVGNVLESLTNFASKEPAVNQLVRKINGR